MSHQDNLARIASDYGVQSTDSFDGDIVALHQVERENVTLEDLINEGGELTRIRLLTERGYSGMDISYCYGKLADGTEVRVELPFYNGDLGRRTYRSQMADAIKAMGGTKAQAQQAWDSGRYAILWG